jgi:hypothetical protein
MKYYIRLMARIGIVALVCASALVASGVQAQSGTGVIRVATTGTNVAGCGSVAQPCQTPHFAVLASIQNGSSFQGEILIAGGTYTQSPDDQLIKITVLSANLRITGGYTTSNWNVSNPVANPTILDGQNGKRGILISVPENVAATCNVTISNLTIQNGRALATDPYGGGVLIDNCSNVRISNVTVKDSKAIGQNDTNAGSSSPGAGGGIAVRGNTNVKGGLTLNTVTLSNNQANGGDEANGARGGLGLGGGLYSIYGSVTATGLTVTNNSVKGGNAPGKAGELNGQRGDGLGGGVTLIYTTFSIDQMTLTGSVAQGGVSGAKGGLGLGGGINIELSTGTILNSTIQANQAIGGASDSGGTGGAGLGGGIFSTDSALTLTNVQSKANSATGATGATNGDAGGGGVYLTTGQTANNSLTATNLIVAANSASSGGGAIFGGGIDCGASQININHATFSGNSLSGGGVKSGGAIALIGFSANAPCSGSVTNSIITDHNSSPILANAFAGTTTFTNILVNNNVGALLDNFSNRPVTTNNVITGDPLFVAPGNLPYDYRIGFGSAAINQAVGSTLTTDFEKQPRPIGAAADLGADEYQVGLAGSSGDTTISLVLTPPPGTTVTNYQVIYTKENGANDATEGASPINAGPGTTINLTGLSLRKTYTVRVLAFNGATQVAESTTLTLTTGRFLINLPLIVY